MSLLRKFRGRFKTNADQHGQNEIALSVCDSQDGVEKFMPKCDNDDEDEVKVKHSKSLQRAAWGGKLDFIMTCISYAVGLGNVWRFPYLCYKNGGGAFLIPYFLMLFLLGLPLFFFELGFGQFASQGPISVWTISPLFKGVGYAMTIYSATLLIYYQVVIAHSMYFLFDSMQSQLPWKCCPTDTDISQCVDDCNNTLGNTTANVTGPSASEYYYYNQVLTMSSGIDNFGSPPWHLALPLLAAWIICALAISKGVQSLGKVVYFTSIFPYVILVILLIRSASLDGAVDGIIYYLNPDFSRLLNVRVWVDAATQIFFSLGCCNGSLIAMSSFNKFKNNCCRDACIVAVINCGTSIFAGLVVFANLGFMAHTKGTTVGTVAKDGPGLAFVVYPEALTNMPVSQLWSVLFFLMMLCLGFGSQFSILESVISGLQDELRKVGFIMTTVKDVTFRCLICVVMFLLGLPMVCSGGFYLFYLVDSFLSSYPLLVIAMVETIVICHVYGVKQFLRDIEMMINERPNWYWRICWMVTIPLFSFGLIVLFFVYNEPLKLGNYVYPNWALSLGHMVAVTPVCAIIIWFVYKYCREGGYILMREFFKPSYDWGPSLNEHRNEFLTRLRDRMHGSSQLDPSNMINSTLGIAGATAGPSGVQFGYSAVELGGSLISGLAGTGIIDDTGFFQSKLSVADKLTKEYSKEVIKRGTSNTELASNDALAALASSQPLIMNPLALIASMSPPGLPSDGTAAAAPGATTATAMETASEDGVDSSSIGGTQAAEADSRPTKANDISSNCRLVTAAATATTATGLPDRADGGISFTTKLSPVRESDARSQATPLAEASATKPDAPVTGL